MKKIKSILSFLLIFSVIFVITPLNLAGAAESSSIAAEKQLIFDEAGLLTQAQADRLNTMANAYGAERNTDIIIYTTLNEEDIDAMILTEDFYDEHAPGYDRPHGNAVILTLDMNNTEVYIAGFYKGLDYLNDRRLDQIRTKISPDLSYGNYELAFEDYILTVHEFMEHRPGVLFNIWFQLAVSLGIGALVVGVMAYRSGGRITVNRQTYEDANASGILDRQDRYLRTTVTKRKIERNNNNGGPGGGGGGGISKGGHSHSGSRGSF